MAGMGAAPKDPSQRARRNKDTFSPTVRLPFERATPPELPEELDWHPMTRRWWRAWQDSPMADLMSEIDWMYMMDTALMHSAMWMKEQWTLAAEVRQRVAAFGSTPLDRLRLRIQWADADQKDASTPQTQPVPTRERYADLHVLPVPGAAGDGGDEDAG